MRRISVEEFAVLTFRCSLLLSETNCESWRTHARLARGWHRSTGCPVNRIGRTQRRRTRLAGDPGTILRTNSSALFMYFVTYVTQCLAKKIVELENLAAL